MSFQHKYILQNATFLVDDLLPVIQDKYLIRTSHSLGHTIELKTSLQRVKRFSTATLGEFVWSRLGTDRQKASLLSADS